MSAPVSVPAEDTTTLDETILDDEIPCRNCSELAAFRISMRCCGANAFKCGRHLGWWRNAFDAAVAEGKNLHCSFCRTDYGKGAGFDQIVRVVPI